MPREAIPELTAAAIKRARTMGDGSIREIAARFKVSPATVKRICQGIKPGCGAEVAAAIVTDAIAHGQPLRIGTLDLTEYLEAMAVDLRADMATVQAKTKEGIAGQLLRLLQFYAELYPPTFDRLVAQLVEHPDFDPQKVKRALERYAQKAS